MSGLAFVYVKRGARDFDRLVHHGDVVEFVDFCYRADERLGLCCNRLIVSVVTDRKRFGYLSTSTLHPLSREAASFLAFMRRLRPGQMGVDRRVDEERGS